MKSSLGVTLMELVNYTQSLEIDPVKVRNVYSFKPDMYKIKVHVDFIAICSIYMLQIYQEMIDNDEVEGPSEPEKLLLEVCKKKNFKSHL